MEQRDRFIKSDEYCLMISDDVWNVWCIVLFCCMLKCELRECQKDVGFEVKMEGAWEFSCIVCMAMFTLSQSYDCNAMHL